MSESEANLSEEAARRIWRRAAELQAEAAQRLEARSRVLVDDGDDEIEGYALTHVRQAAVEAGISTEFVDAALAESPGADAEGPWIRRVLTQSILGSLPANCVASRVFDETPEQVYRALQQLLPSGPYQLSLVDIEGPHPLKGGVMVFEVPAPAVGGTRSDFITDLRIWADVKVLRLRVRGVGEEDQHCEVSVFASLEHTRKVNAWVGGTMVGGGSILGAVVAASVAGPFGVLAAPFVWVTASAGWRGLSLIGLRRGQRALGRLLQGISGFLRTGGAFSAGSLDFPALPAGPPGPPDETEPDL